MMVLITPPPKVIEVASRVAKVGGLTIVKRWIFRTTERSNNITDM